MMAAFAGGSSRAIAAYGTRLDYGSRRLRASMLSAVATSDVRQVLLSHAALQDHLAQRKVRYSLDPFSRLTARCDELEI
jgi:hypothetical protein